MEESNSGDKSTYIYVRIFVEFRRRITLVKIIKAERPQSLQACRVCLLY